ncbi:uncharacterized mitochondrial protein AtMg00810-like [Humulus lupulus]|uniref:uncharacterized mitochondrial protein AtMg00810-like n=1 Tax=Humulus lupulus TaxID=3486 RepID=UPI002B412421|nr:uncharacterized mitochondrial protein AtMg00810-like [Humulus lupulus]
MTTGKPLSAYNGIPLENPTVYRIVIGALQYLTHTRPDISYPVNNHSQFLKSPITIHRSAAKRILSYLKRTMNNLHITPGDNLNLTCYSDADWACCPDDRRLIGGYCVFLGDTLISWSSKKQYVVARSSAESQYRALSHLAAEISWLQELLQEIKVKLNSVPHVVWQHGSKCYGFYPSLPCMYETHRA